jgi:hypothetical protein
MGGPVKGWSLPDEEYMSCTDGIPENHHYQDLRWIDWSDFQRLCGDARDLIELTDRYTNDDDLSEAACDNEVYLMGIDPEVAPAVFALAAFGAVPFTSCSGDAGHYESHPLVGFWADASLRDAILSAAKNANAKVEPAGYDALVVYHEKDAAVLVNFAHFLKAARVHSAP